MSNTWEKIALKDNCCFALLRSCLRYL